MLSPCSKVCHPKQFLLKRTNRFVFITWFSSEKEGTLIPTDLVATCVRLNLTKIILAAKIQLLRFQNELAAIYYMPMCSSCQPLLPQCPSNNSKTNTSEVGQPTLTFSTPHSGQKGAGNNFKEPFALLGNSSKQKKKISLTNLYI